jgi:hypothetical protein
MRLNVHIDSFQAIKHHRTHLCAQYRNELRINRHRHLSRRE